MSEPEAPGFTPAAERTSKVTLQERQSHVKYETLELSTDDEPLVKGNEQANPNGKRHVLILGGGVSGLLPAWMLLDKGYHVTIIAEHWAWTRDFDKERAGQFKSGYTHMAPIINTDKAMSYLMALVKSKGAVLETRPFKGLIRGFGEKLLEEHKAHAIINATGLGAKELAGDDDVYPVRGAIRRIGNTRKGEFRHLNDAFLVPAQRDLNGNPTKTVFIVPRSDDVLYVGSIIQPEATDKLSQDSIEVEVMWDRAGDFIPRLRHAGPVPGFPFAQGLRPFTKRNVKVRADDNVETKFPLVHNYGHGGSGWTLGVGTARCAVHIVEQFMGLNAESLLKRYGTGRNSGDVPDPAIKTLIERTAEARDNLAALEKVLENDEDIRLLDYQASVHKKAVDINKQLYGEAPAVAAH
ncbi:hypothetical protein INS49_013865 [Diaporthe citri]|uniref:uncharacterized protein n=1 Tax=Diaporthe citri TaxID=83186 RepID=UPI001C812666|nr:uncharacterized protein INS49_013865 [Diaporthe citri]KAG6357982.1 hypothetical protein INS49_013865 [Diaporthe citri]